MQERGVLDDVVEHELLEAVELLVATYRFDVDQEARLLSAARALAAGADPRPAARPRRPPRCWRRSTGSTRKFARRDAPVRGVHHDAELVQDGLVEDRIGRARGRGSGQGHDGGQGGAEIAGRRLMRILPSLRHRELQSCEQRHIVPLPAGNRRQQGVLVALDYRVARRNGRIHRPPGQTARQRRSADGPDVPGAVARRPRNRCPAPRRRSAASRSARPSRSPRCRPVAAVLRFDRALLLVPGDQPGGGRRPARPPRRAGRRTRGPARGAPGHAQQLDAQADGAAAEAGVGAQAPARPVHEVALVEGESPRERGQLTPRARGSHEPPGRPRFTSPCGGETPSSRSLDSVSIERGRHRRLARDRGPCGRRPGRPRAWY